MAETNLNGIMESTLTHIQQMVEGNAVVGEAIHAGDDTVIIPVSKISIGFGAGGTDFPTKKDASAFGGGCGAGVTVTPQAFLVISGGNVRLIQLAAANNTADRVLNLVPDVMDRFSAFFDKAAKSGAKASEVPVTPVEEDPVL